MPAQVVRHHLLLFAKYGYSLFIPDVAFGTKSAVVFIVGWDDGLVALIRIQCGGCENLGDVS